MGGSNSSKAEGSIVYAPHTYTHIRVELSKVSATVRVYIVVGDEEDKW